MDDRRLRAAFVMVIVAAAVLLLARSASVPLLDPDEARFARTSVEMMRSNDLVVPHFEGRPRLVKPPMLHWIQSTLFRAFGPSSWAARLPAALSTLGSILLVAWVARRRFGAVAAIWAAAFLGTMPLVLVPARAGTLDALLALHVLAAVALDIADPQARRDHRGLAVGAILGLAFLVKGPVGVVLPLLIMLAGRTAARRDVLPSWSGVFQAIAGWAVVVLPWGIAFMRRIGWEAAVGIVRGEAFERYFVGEVHTEPAWFYFMVAIPAFLPWTGPLVVALASLPKLWREPGARTALYAGAGLVAGLVFFSLSPSKLPTYILPLAPLAALVVTWQFGRELAAGEQRTTGAGLVALTLAISAAALGTAGWTSLEGVPRQVALLGGAIYGGAAVLAIVSWAARRPPRVYGAAGIAAGAFLLVLVLVLFPEVAKRRSSAYLIEEVPALRSGRPLVVVDMRLPSMTYYLDRVPETVPLVDLPRRLGQDDDPLIVFDLVDLNDVPREIVDRLLPLGGQGKYMVFEKAGEGRFEPDRLESGAKIPDRGE